ncbi:hypothetical protein [Paraburkholderia aspalathi]
MIFPIHSIDWRSAFEPPQPYRARREAVLALAQAGEIDVVLFTELTRWG